METKTPSILFMGTPYFAARALRGLVEAGFSVTGVVTRPDTIKGRSASRTPSEAKIEANKYNIPVFQPENKAELTEIVKKLKPDLIIVAAFGMIIPGGILEVPRYGALNIHGSLLPKYRGASPITEAILNGDKVTGITIMKMSPGMDEGDIITNYQLPITTDDTTESLTKKMAGLGAKAIVETIPKWVNEEIKSTSQNDDEATYCHKISKEDGHIDWNEPAEVIERKIRAYTPWPSAYFFLNGKRIKILKANIPALDVMPANAGIHTPGTLLIDSNRLFVTTSSDTLEILELQPEGKKPMTARDFINGNKGINESKLG